MNPRISFSGDQVDGWIKMLQDGDITQRETAVIGLESSRDTRAIEPLRQVCMYDFAPSVRSAATKALKAFGQETPLWVDPPTPKDFLRTKIEQLIRAALERSPSTKHEKTVSKHTESHEDVLSEGDLELRSTLHLEDGGLIGYGVTATYCGREVFVDRPRGSIYIPGEWEVIVAKLAGKDKKAPASH
jgi:hypothetical protein